jgi:signal transduction histidine kinase
MLAYGLWPAIDELLDELADQIPEGYLLRFEIPRSECRYDPKVEEHCYRIVQQACENALQHAQAATLCVSGVLAESQITLEVSDDGIGLLFRQHDLQTLVANRHFGLAGIHERAHLLGADLRIESSPGRGTRLTLMIRMNQSQTAVNETEHGESPQRYQERQV